MAKAEACCQLEAVVVGEEELSYWAAAEVVVPAHWHLHQAAPSVVDLWQPQMDFQSPAIGWAEMEWFREHFVEEGSLPRRLEVPQ